RLAPSIQAGTLKSSKCITGTRSMRHRAQPFCLARPLLKVATLISGKTPTVAAMAKRARALTVPSALHRSGVEALLATIKSFLQVRQNASRLATLPKTERSLPAVLYARPFGGKARALVFSTWLTFSALINLSTE